MFAATFIIFTQRHSHTEQRTLFSLLSFMFSMSLASLALSLMQMEWRETRSTSVVVHLRNKRRYKAGQSSENARNAFEPNKIISGIQCNLNLVLYLCSVLFDGAAITENFAIFLHSIIFWAYSARCRHHTNNNNGGTSTQTIFQEINVNGDKRLLQRNTMYQRA